MPVDNGLIALYELNKKYQCPFYCKVDHIHKIHYEDKKCDKCNHFTTKRHKNH